MNLYYSSPSEQKDPAFTLLCVIDSTGRTPGQIPADFTRIDHKGLCIFGNKGPVRVPVHHEVKKPALDEVSQEGLLMAMEERYPDSVVVNLEKITWDADIPGLPAPFLEGVMVAVIISVNTFYLTFKGREHRDHEWRDKIPGMEKELLRFMIQSCHRFFQIGDIVMGIPKYTYFQRDTPQFLCSCVARKMVPECPFTVPESCSSRYG
jgi:hypothetical protein